MREREREKVKVRERERGGKGERLRERVRERKREREREREQNEVLSYHIKTNCDEKKVTQNQFNRPPDGAIQFEPTCTY